MAPITERLVLGSSTPAKRKPLSGSDTPARCCNNLQIPYYHYGAVFERFDLKRAISHFKRFCVFSRVGHSSPGKTSFNMGVVAEWLVLRMPTATQHGAFTRFFTRDTYISMELVWTIFPNAGGVHIRHRFISYVIVSFVGQRAGRATVYDPCNFFGICIFWKNPGTLGAWLKHCQKPEDAAPRMNALLTVELDRDIFAFDIGHYDFPSC
jgi:hypothetical protein